MRTNRILTCAILGIVGGCAIGCVGGTPATKVAPAANSGTPTSATIHVLVFNDLNGNGTHDANEPGVQDPVFLTKGTACGDVHNLTRETTQPDGTLVISNLAPGPFCVGYGGNSSTTSPVSVKLNLAPGQEITVKFGIKPD